jgi:hypothetical protein
MKSSTLKNTLMLVALSGITLVSIGLISKSLKKTKTSRKQESTIEESATSDVNANSVRFPQSIVLIGDSQTARTLGEAYTNEFAQSSVRFFGKPGATHNDYLQDPTLKNELKKLGCAEVIVIQLGDNGISSRKSDVLDFVNLIRSNCPNTKHIFWAGPMKAVKPTLSNSTYVNTTDPSSPRYLDTYNQTRRLWDQRLKEWLPEANVIYFSNYFAQEAQPSSNAFSDSRGGDGIHLEESSAIEQVKLLKAFILNQLLS